MGMRDQILGRLVGKRDGSAVFLPDLTLWYEWHRRRGTLPERWRGLSMAEIAQDMGAGVWKVVTPWRVTARSVNVTRDEQAGERTLRIEAPSGTLQSRWTLGPDGDWWQAEYPIKSKEDFGPALEWIAAREYVVDAAVAEEAASTLGDDGILALAIPRRPYAELLNDLLGWSDGLLLLGEPETVEVLEMLDGKLQGMVQEIAGLPGDVIYSPDNLDGQFVSPRAFARYLSGSYRSSVDALATQDKPLLVHAGGPIAFLLKPLVGAGVSGVEGVCGPPQGDTTLPEARDVAGHDSTLWGGIPQDMLLDSYPREQFESAVLEAVDYARSDPRVILGVADKVPPEADLDRLAWVQSIVVEAGRPRSPGISNGNRTQFPPAE